jgi:hypothetical protein
MRQHNAENERVKREYLIYLKAAKGLSEASLYSDADYFRLSEKDTRIAKAGRERPVPTLEQIRGARSPSCRRPPRSTGATVP